MDLIVFRVRIWDIEDYFIILTSDTHIAAHFAWIIAHARRVKLNACRDVPAFRMNGVGK